MNSLAIFLFTIDVFILCLAGDIPKSVKFHLWTRTNPEKYKTLIFDEDFSMENLSKSAFNATADTKVYIHGYLSRGTKNYILAMKDAFLQAGDVNFMSVDWDWKSLGISNMNYWTAVKTVKLVGDHFGDFVHFLVQNTETTTDNFHLVGHSLGAHVAARAGHRLNGTLGRLTGLDPAKPDIAYKEKRYRLDKGDAKFVDVIHTNGGHKMWNYAIANPLGHVDFYPNGGVQVQPGCMWTALCSHRRAYVYFTESIVSPNGFPAFKCQSWEAFQEGYCLSNETSFLGNPNMTADRGKFYLETNSAPPYGKSSTKAAPNRDSLFKRVWSYITSWG